MRYKDGVYRESCPTQVDHAVTLVGYTAQYWILKNSWGTRWGEGGYMKFARVGGSGQCGIMKMCNYPKV